MNQLRRQDRIDDYLYFEILKDIKDKNIDIKPNATWIIASPSDNHLGQMTIDVILCTCSIQIEDVECFQIGKARSNLVHPFAGYESYHNEKESSLCTAIDIFAINRKSSDEVIYVLLQRSPCIQKQEIEAKFAKLLLIELRKYKFQDVLIVSGSSTEGMEPNIKLVSNIFITSSFILYLSHYSRNFTYTINADKSIMLNKYSLLREYSQGTPKLFASNLLEISDINDEEEYHFMPPFGIEMCKEFIKTFYQEFQAKELVSNSLCLVGRYLTHNDSTNDALELAASICYFIGITDTLLLSSTVAIPLSWKLLHERKNQDPSMQY